MGFENNILNTAEPHNISWCERETFRILIFLKIANDQETVMEQIRMGLTDHLMRLHTTNGGGLQSEILILTIYDDSANIDALDGHLTGVSEWNNLCTHDGDVAVDLRGLGYL